jgi:phage terminase large subunit-like protein
MNAELYDDPSPARRLVRRLVGELGYDAAHIAIETLLSRLTLDERIALAHYWPFWARSKQLPPAIVNWRSWGFLTSRRWGKTYGIAQWFNGEVEAGNIRQIGLSAQDEENSILLQVQGTAGLIETAPPWCKPEWEAGAKILHWPNGARAVVRTPERPGKIRGFEYDACWLSELQSWPTKTRAEAMSNFRLATSKQPARIVWDATPKRGNPLLKELIAESESNPERFVIVRGSIYENRDELGAQFIADEEARIGGTRTGREELYGHMLDDDEGVLVQQDWIDRNRKSMPGRILRRVIAIDSAVTKRAGNDLTGIIDAARGTDGLVYILGDYTKQYSPEEWPDVVIDNYFVGRCDCVVVETNKAGDYVTSSLRFAAKAREMTVHVLGKNEIPRHVPGVVNVREVFARGPKAERAKPLSTAYEKRLIAHVFGVDLAELEELLTTWVPEEGMRSPDRIDAEVHAVGELRPEDRNARQGYVGLTAANHALDDASRRPRSPFRFSFGDGGGDAV